MTTAGVAMTDVLRARRRLHGRIRRTPLVASDRLSEVTGAEVLLKLEHHQKTGSFKVRGATNAILALTDDERARGVVGVSTGNHGRGLAAAAREAGTRCVICMSRLVPRNKVEAIKALGADVRIVGNSQDDAQVEVDRLVAHEGLTMLPPFDHPAIIAGQGTLGLELFDDRPDVGTVIVPLSGGGLVAGIALAARTLSPGVRVVAVSMTRGAAMAESQQAGRPVVVEELPTLADSLGGGIGLENQYTFALVRDLVDEIVTLDEPEIADGIRYAYWHEREVVEGSGAIGISALLAGRVATAGPTVVVLTGRNIDMALHCRVVSGETPDLMDEA